MTADKGNFTGKIIRTVSRREENPPWTQGVKGTAHTNTTVYWNKMPTGFRLPVLIFLLISRKSTSKRERGRRMKEEVPSFFVTRLPGSDWAKKKGLLGSGTREESRGWIEQTDFSSVVDISGTQFYVSRRNHQERERMRESRREANGRQQQREYKLWEERVPGRRRWGGGGGGGLVFFLILNFLRSGNGWDGTADPLSFIYFFVGVEFFCSYWYYLLIKLIFFLQFYGEREREKRIKQWRRGERESWTFFFCFFRRQRERRRGPEGTASTSTGSWSNEGMIIFIFKIQVEIFF